MSSASEFGKDHGVIHEALVTGRKAGWGAKEWGKCADDLRLMHDIRAVMEGRAEIHVHTHVVDCSVLPPSIGGMAPLPASEQIASRFTGELTLTPEATALYLDPCQEGAGEVNGYEFRTRLEGQKVYPAQVLNYYLAYPALIPEMWKGKVVFFWGTVYRDSRDRLYVRYLFWMDGRWRWDYKWLDNNWHSTLLSVVSTQ